MQDTFHIDQRELQQRTNVARDYPASFTAVENGALWIEAAEGSKRLAVMAQPDAALLRNFVGDARPFMDEYILQSCPLNAANARALFQVLPKLRPTLLGLTTSAGCGDRLGLATPGHVRALQQVLAAASGRAIAPIFAQQSIREMGRTQRTAEDVMTDATWGAFQGGWRGSVGADADHLKTTADIDTTVAAGFTFFTIDPGEYVDNEADAAPIDVVRRKVEQLPWSTLESSTDDLRRSYVGRRITLDDRTVVLDEEVVWRAAAKYGGAVAHVSSMYRHLVSKGVPFELEISVDETETPTSHQEHIYIVQELRRLKVEWVSLAPRYIGRFEKGVDFIGDLGVLRADLAGHAAIARSLGPYKLSLHSGSDKFSVYAIITGVTQGLVHLKTAGTSYLEALRVVAEVDSAFFREILAFGREHYETDKVSYHVSADLNRVPTPATVPDQALPALLDDFDARQVLHVTFGSALAEFRSRLFDLLRAHEELYTQTITAHFVRHLTPFV